MWFLLQKLHSYGEALILRGTLAPISTAYSKLSLLSKTENYNTIITMFYNIDFNIKILLL